MVKLFVFIYVIIVSFEKLWCKYLIKMSISTGEVSNLMLYQFRINLYQNLIFNCNFINLAVNI